MDKVDFLENACEEQSTLHGTVIVINLENVKNGEPLNKPIQIPDKVSPIQLEVLYHTESSILLKPVQFDAYQINLQLDLLKRYEANDRT